MSTALAAPRLMTTEEFLALPDDGVDRWLINGELREAGMSVRNRFHSDTMAQITIAIGNWIEGQAEPKGRVMCGDAGFRLRAKPDTAIGIDVAYVSAEIMKRQTADITIIEGVPVVAVEILSPSDNVEDIEEKVDSYRDAGVRQVWIVDPHDRTVTVYRPGEEPVLFNAKQELTAEPDLPGFRVAVARLFR